MPRIRGALLGATLTASVLVFAWPEISLALRGVTGSYPLVTAVFTLLIVAAVAGWPRDDAEVEAPGPLSWNWLAAIVALAGLAIVAYGLYRWTRLIASEPYHADMLIVIREATRRLLRGQMPYTTYRSYDAPWDMAMPYGPALWGPFLVPQLLHLDLRLLTTTGALIAPVWCGGAAIVHACRRRVADAVMWLAVTASLVLAIDVQQFTLIGHTPVYWPWLLLFPVMMTKRRWVESACLLGILVVARTTMVAIVPVFVMGVWSAGRRRAGAAIVALTATAGTALAPFLVWDGRALWDSMVLSYPRVMSAAVWPDLAKPGMKTIGVTEWLLEHHREGLVVPVQAATMIAVYLAAWFAIRRSERPLPWMALALFAFSMTTLFPVPYLYYDVVLLLVSGAFAEGIGEVPSPVVFKTWLLSLTAIAALVFATLRATTSPFPEVVVGKRSSEDALRAGFVASERDGDRDFAWIVGREARIVLPRSSAASADIVLTARSPFGPGHPLQRMTAILNGTLLAEVSVPEGWREIRIAGARGAWWVGYNELRLTFSSAASPRDAGAGDDPRPLALAVSRVDVVKRPK